LVVWARPQTGSTVSAEYYFANVDELPIAESGTPGIPGRALYPPSGSRTHIRGSGIARVDPSTFAFLDFSPQDRSTRLVTVRLSSTEPPEIVERVLQPSDFSEGTISTAATPGAPTISRVAGEGLTLRVDFAAASAAASGRSATVRMW
jgi:hypothetical protein